MEVNSLIKEKDFDLLATALTYLKQKKINVIDSIVKKFDNMSEGFEPNPFQNNTKRFHQTKN